MPQKIELINGYGALRSVLEAECAKAGCGLGDLTVLFPQLDPYRADTDAGHRDGQWVAEQIDRLLKRGKRIHWRGLHYAIVAQGNIRKPNGDIYTNTEENWIWLSNVAGKSARWLGYGVQPSGRVQHFDLRLPGRRLRCACGHQLTAHDFDILEPKLVRAVCSRCHADLIVIEID